MIVRHALDDKVTLQALSAHKTGFETEEKELMMLAFQAHLALNRRCTFVFPTWLSG